MLAREYLPSEIDRQSRIEVSVVPQPFFNELVPKHIVAEDIGIMVGNEFDECAVWFLRLALGTLDQLSLCKHRLEGLSITM